MNRISTDSDVIIFKAPRLKVPLFREAKKADKTLSGYIRDLIQTHPSRATKKRGRPKKIA